MWPYTNIENEWIAEQSETNERLTYVRVTPEMMDYYMRRSEKLRAQAVSSMIIAASSWVRHLVVDRLFHDVIGRLAHRTAIRH
tara:strand:+ start:98750 stop:98998 length:249 start_codon:yes stop_codon:yes gene_type:complete